MSDRPLRGDDCQLGGAERASGGRCRDAARAVRAILCGSRLDLRAKSRVQRVVWHNHEEVNHCNDDDERNERVEELAIEKRAAVDRETQVAEVGLPTDGGDQWR